jgi:hypothetical protein
VDPVPDPLLLRISGSAGLNVKHCIIAEFLVDSKPLIEM